MPIEKKAANLMHDLALKAAMALSLSSSFSAPKPGTIIGSLPEEERELLQELKSDGIGSVGRQIQYIAHNRILRQRKEE